MPAQTSGLGAGPPSRTPVAAAATGATPVSRPTPTATPRTAGAWPAQARAEPAERPDLTPLPQRWRARAEIDLSPGVPDLSGFPRAAWLRAEKLVLEQASVADLGYGDPRGSR